MTPSDGFGNLNRLQQNLAKLEGSKNIPAEELLTSRFMLQHTNYGTFDEMVAASPFHVESAEDFAAIPEDQWDAFVREKTNFQSWDDMVGLAAKEWAQRKLFDGID